MKTIFVNLGQYSYHIVIGRDILEDLGSLIQQFSPDLSMASGGSKRIAIITDNNVARLYADRITNQFTRLGFVVKQIVITPGEDQKSLLTAERLYEALFEHRMDRSSLIIALGGGVIGDLAGFVASTFMRGIPYIQVPTTLLAQVDSGVGGKTGINHPRGKNMIGSFYQPRGVFIDTDTLATLPKEELIGGMAEVIKYGMIRSQPLFQYIEDSLSNILQLNSEALEHIIFSSCKIKAEVVEEDEKEGGLRAILNYGHTIGHAIESLTEYAVYRHGEAVAIGMICASKISREMGLIGDPVIERQRLLLERLGAKTRIKADIRPAQLVERLYHDKKTIGGRLRFILPVEIGRVIISDKVTEGIICKVLEEGRD